MSETQTVTAASPNPPRLAWGLQPPAGTTVAWGARAIYERTTTQKEHKVRRVVGGVSRTRIVREPVTVYSFDLLPDRQDTIGSEADRKALGKWLDKQLPKFRKRVDEEHLGTNDEGNVELEADGYRIVGSPRASYGYLYIVAYPVPVS